MFSLCIRNDSPNVDRSCQHEWVTERVGWGSSDVPQLQRYTKSLFSREPTQLLLYLS